MRTCTCEVPVRVTKSPNVTGAVIFQIRKKRETCLTHQMLGSGITSGRMNQEQLCTHAACIYNTAWQVQSCRVCVYTNKHALLLSLSPSKIFQILAFRIKQKRFLAMDWNQKLRPLAVQIYGFICCRQNKSSFFFKNFYS